MNNKIIEHHQHMLKLIKQDMHGDEKEKLYRYHISRVRDFQHERLIHLIVTLFFALLFLISIVIWLVVTSLNIMPSWPLGVLSLILIALEIAYIRHYYLLENGVQALYDITEKLK